MEEKMKEELQEELEKKTEGTRFKLKIKITQKALFSFMLHHANTSFSGIFGIGISVLALVILFGGYANVDIMSKCILLFVGLAFTVINPVMMYYKAGQQVKKNPMYQRELNYELYEEGISLVNENKREYVPWSKIVKFKKTKSVLALYTTRIHAVILPTAEFPEQKDEVEAFIRSKVRGK